MPRGSRMDAPGGLHHIMFRGIERRKIFRDDADRRDLLERLEAVVKDGGMGCYAWALMPNHVHLLVRSGTTPLSMGMRRVLTGYAVRFNLRYRRHGHLFQNRYRSVLCQEEPYLLELVRYIHLNPVRAGLVRSIEELDVYPWSGHSALMGEVERPWQNVDTVLGRFGEGREAARERYYEFVRGGLNEGERDELEGGGLVRSAGGWAAVKAARRAGGHMVGDERILGDSQFVEGVLRAAEELFEQKTRYTRQGYDLTTAAARAGEELGVEVEEITTPGKGRRRAEARGVACYWATRELGRSTVDVGKAWGLSQSAVSKAARRGEVVVRERGLVFESKKS